MEDLSTLEFFLFVFFEFTVILILALEQSDAMCTRSQVFCEHYEEVTARLDAQSNFTCFLHQVSTGRLSYVEVFRTLTVTVKA